MSWMRIESERGERERDKWTKDTKASAVVLIHVHILITVLL